MASAVGGCSNATLSLDRNGTRTSRLHGRAGPNLVYRPCNHCPEYDHRHPQRAFSDAAGAAAAADSTHVQATELLYRFAEVQVARAATLANTHLQRPRRRAVRRRLSRCPEL